MLHKGKKERVSIKNIALAQKSRCSKTHGKEKRFSVMNAWGVPVARSAEKKRKIDGSLGRGVVGTRSERINCRLKGVPVRYT